MKAVKKQDDAALVEEVREMFRRLRKEDRKDAYAFCERLIADADAEVAAKRAERSKAAATGNAG